MATARGMTVPHTFTDVTGKAHDSGRRVRDRELQTSNTRKVERTDLTDEGTFSQSGVIVTFKPDDGDLSYTGVLVADRDRRLQDRERSSSVHEVPECRRTVDILTSLTLSFDRAAAEGSPEMPKPRSDSRS
jgi:hypothetical protein